MSVNTESKEDTYESADTLIVGGHTMKQIYKRNLISRHEIYRRMLINNMKLN